MTDEKKAVVAPSSGVRPVELFVMNADDAKMVTVVSSTANSFIDKIALDFGTRLGEQVDQIVATMNITEAPDTMRTEGTVSGDRDRTSEP